ncbi:hypothetical protein [Corallococcus sp. EGB]|uniref:hypothetical protein n=1 Tax=Corallococcus sp. EGB TaxID=1521117 RepID=UPI001CBC6221|nr:hypothetical protein [Corallococcus sp. EGB]
MKPIIIAAALALGLCSCTESSPVVQITSIKLPSATCTVESDAPGIARGSLDVSVGRSYVLAFLVNNTYAQTAVDIGETPLEPGDGTGGAGTAFVKTLRLSYATSPNINLPSGTVNYTAGLSPSSEGNILVANLLTAEASQKLADSVALGQSVEVSINVQFAGEFSASNKKFETNEVVYSFTAYKSGVTIPACAAGEVPDALAPCGQRGGQEGAYPKCQ